MGSACCMNRPIKSTGRPAPFEPFPDLDDIHVPQNGLDESHLASSVQRVATKRTNESSLIHLNTQIDNLILTFEHRHGKIANSFTRSNTLPNSKLLTPQMQKQRLSPNDDGSGSNRLPTYTYLREETVGEEVYEVLSKQSKNDKENQCKQQKFSQFQNEGILKGVVTRFRDKEQDALHLTDSIENSLGAEGKPHSDNRLDLNFDGSCTWEDENSSNTDNQQFYNQGSANLLNVSLVDPEVRQQRQALIKRYSLVEGIVLGDWDEANSQSFSMLLKDVIDSQLNNNINNAALCSIASYYELFNISLCAFEKRGTSHYAKICINGHRRSMATQSTNLTPVLLFSEVLYRLYKHNRVSTNPCNQVYHLSGWVPQVIHLGDIQNKQNLWDRLVQNYSDGNIIITFGCADNQRYLTLSSIHTQTSKLRLVYSEKGEEQVVDPERNICEVTWDKLVQIVSTIYINWNPSIYSFTKKVDSRWMAKVQPFKNQAICLQNNPQYLIKIPKHSEDFELRVFADRFIQNFCPGKRLCLKLFQYDGERILNPNQAIRTLQIDYRELISDVFIFEKSNTVDYFVLVVLHDDDECHSQIEIAFSLLFLCFVDIQIKQLPQKEVIASAQISAIATKNNLGFGLNSPDFLNNLQFSLQVVPQSAIQVLVESAVECEFSLILVQDKSHHLNIAKIDFQSVLNESVITEVFDQYGFIQRKTANQHYILVIAMSKLPSKSCKFTITTSIMSNTSQKSTGLQRHYSPVTITQTFSKPTILNQCEVKWTMNSPGPRKRMKHTSTQVVYHPASVFQEFLKNPCVTFELEKGEYQFSLVCDNYRREFLERDHTEGQPPALSLGILMSSDNNKGYKIVMDDAFYVPIGYGFWTSTLLLQKGRYTIVCSRIEKAMATGRLRLVKV